MSRVDEETKTNDYFPFPKLHLNTTGSSNRTGILKMHQNMIWSLNQVYFKLHDFNSFPDLWTENDLNKSLLIFATLQTRQVLVWCFYGSISFSNTASFALDWLNTVSDEGNGTLSFFLSFWLLIWACQNGIKRHGEMLWMFLNEL